MATLIPSIGTCVTRMTKSANAVQVMTMKVSKGLALPVAALLGVGHMPAKGVNEAEAARGFYVAVTWATQRLTVGARSEAKFGEKL